LIMNTMLRKSLLAVTGLTLAGGVVAGPATTALAADAKPAAAAVQGDQSTITLSAEQKDNAKAIIAATKKAGMDERAAVIAVGTALQESKLENLGHLGDRNDHDSQGLFQQRPSSGWGTVEQITDPEYSTTAFLKGLKAVDGWQDMPLTKAAQKVQVSAYPDAYAQWETQAADLVAEHWTS
jgi:hypothetical protein